MRAMLGGDGGGSSGQCASAEPPIERRKVVSDCGRGGRQRRGASEPAPGHERRPITRIEPQCFGGGRTPGRRRSGLCRAVCSRWMRLGVHTFVPVAFVRSRGIRPRHANPKRFSPLARIWASLIKAR